VISVTDLDNFLRIPREEWSRYWRADFVKSLRSSYTGLYPQRICDLSGNRFDGPLPECPGGRYRGTSLIRNRPPPYDHHRALGIFLL